MNDPLLLIGTYDKESEMEQAMNVAARENVRDLVAWLEANRPGLKERNKGHRRVADVVIELLNELPKGGVGP